MPAELQPAADFLLATPTESVPDMRTGDMLPQVRDAIIALWADPATKEVVGMSSRFQLNDSAEL